MRLGLSQYLLEITAVLGPSTVSLVVPINIFFVTIELHLFGYSYFFKRFQYEGLFRGRKSASSTSTFKVWITAPMVYAYRHNLSVLVREHTLLKIGETTGVSYGLVVSIVGASFVLTAAVRVNQLQILFLLHQCGVCYLMQASGGQRAVNMFTYRVAVGQRCIFFLRHNSLSVFVHKILSLLVSFEKLTQCKFKLFLLNKRGLKHICFQIWFPVDRTKKWQVNPSILYYTIILT